jgi:hypothetical protein
VGSRGRRQNRRIADAAGALDRPGPIWCPLARSRRIPINKLDEIPAAMVAGLGNHSSELPPPHNRLSGLKSDSGQNAVDHVRQRISRNVHSRNRLAVITVERLMNCWPPIWSWVALTRCASAAHSETSLMISAISPPQRLSRLRPSFRQGSAVGFQRGIVGICKLRPRVAYCQHRERAVVGVSSPR